MSSDVIELLTNNYGYISPNRLYCKDIDGIDKEYCLKLIQDVFGKNQFYQSDDTSSDKYGGILFKHFSSKYGAIEITVTFFIIGHVSTRDIILPICPKDVKYVIEFNKTRYSSEWAKVYRIMAQQLIDINNSPFIGTLAIRSGLNVDFDEMYGNEFMDCE